MDMFFTQALWVLGLLKVEQLPKVASDALESGKDSPALRMLASLTVSEIAEAPKLFRCSLEELGFPVLSRLGAAHIYANGIAKQILSGEISPQDGANKLWDASIRMNDSDFHDFDTFIYAASELRTRPADRDFFYNEIIKEAKIWALNRSVKEDR